MYVLLQIMIIANFSYHLGALLADPTRSRLVAAALPTAIFVWAHQLGIVWR